MPARVRLARSALAGCAALAGAAVGVRGHGWARARERMRLRQLALYRHELAGGGCAPGGAWAARDRRAFEAEFGGERGGAPGGGQAASGGQSG